MADRLRLGVIGAGSWAAAVHLPALDQRRDEVEFVGICRRGERPLRALAERYGFLVASEDYREVLAAGIDIAVVASPAGLHHQHAKAALQAGAHVLCEKPMTINPSDAWDLVDIARTAGRELLVAYGWNFGPLARRAKILLDRYGIGPLEQMSIVMSSQTRELLSNTGAYPDAAQDTAPEPRTWTDTALSGGGYAQAQLTHALGLALTLIPERVTGAFALMSSPEHAPVEFHDAISLRFSGGGIGVLSGGSAHLGAEGNKHALEIRAIGRDGQLLLDVQREALSLFRTDGVNITDDVVPGEGAYPASGPANALINVAQGRHDCNRAPGELGARVVEALFLAYQSARSGHLETAV